MKKKKIKLLIASIIAVMPFNRFRLFLYRLLLGYNINYNSRIGLFNIIICETVDIIDAQIGYFNYVSCQNLEMSSDSLINRQNKIMLMNEVNFYRGSCLNKKNSVVGLYQEDNTEKDQCNFSLGSGSLITNNHGIDCTCDVTIGSNVVIAGSYTQIWTHGFDFNRNMIVKPISIGNNVYIGSRCTITGGVNICDNAMFGAATTISKSINDSGFYVSSQLIKKR